MAIQYFAELPEFAIFRILGEIRHRQEGILLNYADIVAATACTETVLAADFTPFVAHAMDQIARDIDEIIPLADCIENILCEHFPIFTTANLELKQRDEFRGPEEDEN